MESSTMNAEKFVFDLYRNKSFSESFWTGIKYALLILAMGIGSYALYKSSTLRSLTMKEYEDVSLIKAEQLKDEVREKEQYERLSKLNTTFSNKCNSLKNLILLITYIPLLLFKGYFKGNVTSQLDSPDVMFDCYRTSRLSLASVVTYHGCFVDTTKGAMNKPSGVFTVRTPGIYQLTFTAKYVSSSSGRFGAWSDMFVNNTVIGDSQREYNRDESGNSESSTHTILVLYPLRIGDRVRIKFNKDGDSYIHSDDDHDVHFTGRRLSALP